jgi:hypothetical protein
MIIRVLTAGAGIAQSVYGLNDSSSIPDEDKGFSLLLSIQTGIGNLYSLLSSGYQERPEHEADN